LTAHAIFFFAMNSLEIFFADCSETVDETLERLVPAIVIEPKRLHEAVRWSLFAGGKRFRPALLIAVGEAFGARRENLLSTAAAIEMIHTYSLIHDDLPAMDDDDLRRGRETCHVKFDEATAILAGDVLQTLAFQTIADDANLPETIRVKLISEIAKAAGTPIGMVAGQQLDLEAERREISIAELETIHNHKTGAIISVAARSGAIVAEAEGEEIAAISNYAAQLGLLFQITDDLLDATQTSEVLGKTAGKDERAQKATYVSLYGLEKAQKLAETVYAKSCRELETIKIETSLLCAIADFILQRQK
jgi:geranylgeranyl pyrophosphate synthase